MDQYTETIKADKLRWHNDSWDATIYRDGAEAYDHPIYVEGYKIDLDGEVTVEFDEYHTTLIADMEVVVSYVTREFEGGEYTEDHTLESIELL